MNIILPKLFFGGWLLRSYRYWFFSNCVDALPPIVVPAWFAHFYALGKNANRFIVSHTIRPNMKLKNSMVGAWLTEFFSGREFIFALGQVICSDN